MKPEEFVDTIKAVVVTENLKLHTELLRTTKRGGVKDVYWNVTLELYDSLNDRGKAALLAVMKQVAVDTASNLFGILDGSSSSSISEDLRLLDGDRRKLNGSLQDPFVASVEGERQG